MLGVDLVGSRRIWAAHVACLVGPDGSRRIQKDRLDDHRDDQSASDTKSDGKASNGPRGVTLCAVSLRYVHDIRDLLMALQALPRDAELLAFGAGCEDYCHDPRQATSLGWLRLARVRQARDRDDVPRE
jgi:hypothetical protein